MKVLSATVVTLSVLASANLALAAKAHSHGEGQLDVVIEQDRLLITLELPLDAAVGFERAPRNPKEQAAFTDAGKQLESATLFVPTAAAQCRLHAATVSLPFQQSAKNATAAAANVPAGEAHADIEATHEFRCANPAALKGFDTSLFTHFKRLYRVEARRVGPTGQGAARLAPKQPRMSW